MKNDFHFPRILRFPNIPGALAGESLGEIMRLFNGLDWPNQTEVTVAGVHFVQEDSPDEIGRAIADWMGRWADRSQAKHA